MTAPMVLVPRALAARATVAAALAAFVAAPILAAACGFHTTGYGPSESSGGPTTTATGAGGSAATTGNGGATSTTTTTTGGTGGMVPVFPYAHRRRLRVAAKAAAVPADYSIAVTIDHEMIAGDGKSQPSGDDVRIYRDESGTRVELDRMLDPASAWGAPQTMIWFRTRAPIAASTEDASYWLYYGDPSAANPPADGTQVYAIWTDFDDGAPQGNGWAFSQIGSAVGSTSETGSTLTLVVDGDDIWGKSDDFVFLHHDVSGDFVADTHVLSMAGSLGGWSKMGGVMLRQSTSAGSRNRIMSPVRSNAARTNSFRLSDGANTSEVAEPGSDPTPEYERVTRVGDRSRAFRSSDGLSWSEDGAPIVFSQPLVDPVLIGIPACNLDPGKQASVNVAWFRVRKLVEPEPSVTIDAEEPGPF